MQFHRLCLCCHGRVAAALLAPAIHPPIPIARVTLRCLSTRWASLGGTLQLVVMLATSLTAQPDFEGSLEAIFTAVSQT